MGWNGSGVFTRAAITSGKWAIDKLTTLKITTAKHDLNDDELMEGINNCLCKDGQNAATDNINMDSNKIINLADPTNAQDAVTMASLSTLTDYVDTNQIADDAVDTDQIADDAVDKTKIAADVAGYGLAQDVDGSLDVNVDGSTLQIDYSPLPPELKVKAGGIDTNELADGAVTTDKLDLSGGLSVGAITADTAVIGLLSSKEAVEVAFAAGGVTINAALESNIIYITTPTSSFNIIFATDLPIGTYWIHLQTDGINTYDGNVCIGNSSNDTGIDLEMGKVLRAIYLGHSGAGATKYYWNFASATVYDATIS